MLLTGSTRRHTSCRYLAFAAYLRAYQLLLHPGQLPSLLHHCLLELPLPSSLQLQLPLQLPDLDLPLQKLLAKGQLLPIHLASLMGLARATKHEGKRGQGRGCQG